MPVEEFCRESNDPAQCAQLYAALVPLMQQCRVAPRSSTERLDGLQALLRALYAARVDDSRNHDIVRRAARILRLLWDRICS